MKGTTYSEALKEMKPKFYCDAVENNKLPCETQCYYCQKKEK